MDNEKTWYCVKKCPFCNEIFTTRRMWQYACSDTKCQIERKRTHDREYRRIKNKENKNDISN